MTNISLYELIKQKSKEKGRPLKIICDWDECLQPLKPVAVYEVSEKKKTFKEFFEEFWNDIIIEESSSTYTTEGKTKVLNNEELENAVKKWEKEVKLMRKDFKASIYSHPEYRKKREKGEFLSISEDLLKCLKEENLISELIIISQYNKADPDKKE